jgi:chromosomal replication initiation ATPase DnaA
MLALQAQNAHRSSPAKHEPEYPRNILEFMTVAAFAVPVADLRARHRGSAPVALARQCAMYLAHVGFGLSYTEVGRMFGRDRTTAAYACRVIEDLRDDPTTDMLLGVLEQACRPQRGSNTADRGADE